MPDDRGVVREIAWQELFPWLSIVRSARLALAPRLILIAALGLFVTAIGWRTIGGVFSDSDDLRRSGWLELDRAWPWEMHVSTQPIRAEPLKSPPDFRPLDTPLVTTWRWMSSPFQRWFEPRGTFVQFLYALICGLWELAAWALAGGAISRIAALALARDSRVGLLEGLRYGALKWPQYFLAALLPLAGAIALGLIVGVVYGLIMRADFGVLVMSFLWPLLLLAAFVIAILLLGLLFGWALMWPTISVEGTDSFDALSRSYSYTFQRPIAYLYYAIVAAILGLLAQYFVDFFVTETTELALWSASWGAGSGRMQEIERYRALLSLPRSTVGEASTQLDQLSWSFSTGLEVISFWINCVRLLGNAYFLSFFWTAATAIYYLLRSSVDGTEPDEVSVDQQEETFSLPPLSGDSTVVPQVIEPKTKAE
jgi:hypothetical protein